MTIVTIKVHPFDKYLEEWYSNIVFFCKNPQYYYIMSDTNDSIKERYE